MRNGESVAAFEAAFAEYVGARYAIACANGTVTLQAALVALPLQGRSGFGGQVAVPALTMSATTIAVLNVGLAPYFVDVDPNTWLMGSHRLATWADIPVSLYGLAAPQHYARAIDDAAQTLRPHNSGAAFTSYSLQSSKILSTGEGGVLVTNDEALAERARSYLSLGYQMGASQARIDSQAIRSPTFARHHLGMSINGRMNDLTAAEGLRKLQPRLYPHPIQCEADESLDNRRACANLYHDAIAGCDWLTQQHVPEGWTHDYWAYVVAINDGFAASACPDWGETWFEQVAQAIVRHGGERPYAAWRLTYQEPAFRHLAPDGTCPVAEDLQPRLLQFQTNNLASAERNADALRKAIREVGG